jgi:hypothetical protein
LLPTLSPAGKEDQMGWDTDWWRENGRKVKARLTRAEKRVEEDPDDALRVAGEVETLMDTYGYPDWWSRVERLKVDATFSKQRKEW